MSVNIYNSNPNATSEEENFSRVADRGSKLASDTIYSNTTSGLNSVNVQGAIDEVNGKVEDNIEAISRINSDLSDNTTPQFFSPPEYGGKIVFCKLGKIVICMVNGWVCINGQTGQVIPVNLRPTTPRYYYGTAHKEGDSAPIGFRVDGAYIQFLDQSLYGYTTGTMYGTVMWVLD